MPSIASPRFSAAAWKACLKNNAPEHILPLQSAHARKPFRESLRTVHQAVRLQSAHARKSFPGKSPHSAPSSTASIRTCPQAFSVIATYCCPSRRAGKSHYSGGCARCHGKGRLDQTDRFCQGVKVCFLSGRAASRRAASRRAARDVRCGHIRGQKRTPPSFLSLKAFVFFMGFSDPCCVHEGNHSL
jgi:hypothetical protein